MRPSASPVSVIVVLAAGAVNAPPSRLYSYAAAGGESVVRAGEGKVTVLPQTVAPLAGPTVMLVVGGVVSAVVVKVWIAEMASWQASAEWTRYS